MPATTTATHPTIPATASTTPLRQNAIFRRLFAAYTLSTIGDWLDGIAVLTLFAYAWNSDPRLLALIPLAYAVPGILFGQAAGVLADRHNRRNLMILADLVSAAVTTVLIFAGNPWAVLVLLALRSAAGLVNLPAQQALTRQVVAEDHLLKATAWNGIVNQLAKVLGPLAGGLLASLTSPKICLLLNAVSFVLSALILLTISPAKTATAAATASEEKTSPRGCLKEGWRIVLRTRVLLAGLLFGLVGFFVIQLVDYQFPVLMRSIAPEHPEWLGWSMAAIGAGSVAILAVLQRSSSMSYATLFGGGYLLIGVGLTGYGWLPYDPLMLWLLLIALIVGIGNGMVLLSLQVLVQTETPADAVGRVQGIISTFSSAVWIVAPLTGGALVATFGAGSAFVAFGMLLAVLGLGGWLARRRLFGS